MTAGIAAKVLGCFDGLKHALDQVARRPRIAGRHPHALKDIQVAFLVEQLAASGIHPVSRILVTVQAVNVADQPKRPIGIHLNQALEPPHGWRTKPAYQAQ